MKEFLLVFRNEPMQADEVPSPEQMQAMMKPWQDWIGSIAAQNKLSSPGNRLESEGKVIRPGNVITNGPYAEIKENIGGYIMVKATDLDEATSLASNCPILEMGGSVEIRTVAPMDPID